jgi:hypothetical protein
LLGHPLHRGEPLAGKFAVWSYGRVEFYLCETVVQVVDDEADKNTSTVPVIYEDKDESDEEISGDAMETDGEDGKDEQASDDEFDGVSDTEGSDDIID